jgi:hypothetical protein
MNLQTQLVGLLANGFQISDLEDAAKIAAAAALEQLPGSSLTERIDWAKNEMLGAVESVDHLVPVLGQWMDTPLADALERWTVNEVCERLLRPLLSWADAFTQVQAA